MNKSGARSAVRVIRLDELLPKQDAPALGRAVAASEPEPEWSSLPPMTWPEPIGSGRLRATEREAGVASAPEPRAMPEPESRSAPGPVRHRGDGEEMPRLPRGVVTSWPLRFQAQAPDYVRLWWRNMLLILLTAGLYLPWARVRSQRYLMRHTRVAGHALDYHEPPSRLLPRYGLTLCLVLGVAGAWSGSPLAGMLALSVALAVWPLLVFMSLTQRMAHISWAHRRLAFDAACQDVYRAMWAPLAGGGALAWLLMAVVIVRNPVGWVAWGAAAGLWLLAMPAFVWTWYLFRQRQLRLGPLHLWWKASRPAVLMMFVRTLAWATLATAFSAGLAAVGVAALLVARGRLTFTGKLGIALAMLMLVCAAVQPYAQARLQNLVWNQSGNRYLRFRSKLSVSAYVALQCKHALLLVLTLGLYWPWAVIATRRMRAQALTVWSRVDADVLKAHWPPHELPGAR